MKRLLTFCVLLLLALPLIGCNEPEGFDESQEDTINVWHKAMVQDFNHKNTDDVLADFAALPGPQSGHEAAQIFALAVEKRCGYAQYALLNESLRANTRVQYEARDWVTGIATPWIESFDIEQGKQNNHYTITFFLKTSSGSLGQFQVAIEIEEAGGACLITQLEPVSGEAVPYVVL